MIIQDTIMGITSIIFVVSLFMQILKILKKKDTSSFSYFLTFGNTLALVILCACMFSLELYLSATVLTIQCILWGVVSFLKLKYEWWSKQ